MGSREQEKAIFDVFLRKEPKFAGEEIDNWTQPADEKEFPDVICTSTSGHRIGVELTEWLNEGEIQAAIGLESRKLSIDEQEDLVGLLAAEERLALIFDPHRGSYVLVRWRDRRCGR